MAIRIHFNRTCDRCAHPFEELIVADLSAIPATSNQPLRLTLGESLLFSWSDICPTCQKAIEGLISRLRLDPRKKTETDSAEIIETPKAL